VRLFVDAASNLPSIYEFAVFSDAPRVNYALGAMVTASSVWQNNPTYGANKANDGDLGTRWNARATNQVGCWLELDFGAPLTFNKTVLRQFADRVTSYEIRYWTGGSWATAITGGQLGRPALTLFRRLRRARRVPRHGGDECAEHLRV
jgi:hypothetical protein